MFAISMPKTFSATETKMAAALIDNFLVGRLDATVVAMRYARIGAVRGLTHTEMCLAASALAFVNRAQNVQPR